MLIKLLLVVVIVTGFASHSLAADEKSTLFPPVTRDNTECGNDQLRVMSWAKGALSTICLTGQEVLTLAIPTCAANQQVVYDGSKYICRSPTTIPTCTGSQYLSFNGSDYECKSNTPPPTCTASQVLTYDGSDYVCIERSDAIPACASGYFLTYNGTSYQCAKNKEVAIPECAAEQALKGIGGKLVCIDLPSVAWAEVDLASTDQFSVDCMYRFTMPWTTPYVGSPWTPDLWMYASGVGPDTLIWVAHSGVISHVNADSKSVYRVNGGVYPLSVARMQKKCPN